MQPQGLSIEGFCPLEKYQARESGMVGNFFGGVAERENVTRSQPAREELRCSPSPSELRFAIELAGKRHRSSRLVIADPFGHIRRLTLTGQSTH
jgi:hypothetical protein